MALSELLNVDVTPLIQDAYMPGFEIYGACTSCDKPNCEMKFSCNMNSLASIPTVIFACDKPECNKTAAFRYSSLELTRRNGIAEHMPVWVTRTNGIIDKEDKGWELCFWRFTIDGIIKVTVSTFSHEKTMTLLDFVEMNETNPNLQNILTNLESTIRNKIISIKAQMADYI